MTLEQFENAVDELLYRYMADREDGTVDEIVSLLEHHIDLIAALKRQGAFEEEFLDVRTD